jgi:glutamine synthetase
MNENKQKLKEVSEKFISDTFFVPIIGAEIEFYLPNTSLDTINKTCTDAGVAFLDVKAESGKCQWEISILHKNNPVFIADEIIKIRQVFEDADFTAKPFADDYGNSLHINVSLLDADGGNIFAKNNEEESQYMQYAIAGLLERMPEDIGVFAPYDNCYERLKGGKNAPSTVSWGGNNRTVALRLPATTGEHENRRIEHRVSSADADPYLVISAILQGVSYGLLNKILPESPKIYGDASLEIYGLPRLF